MKPALPITEQGAAAFLEAYAWLASSRHPRDRAAYRLVEFLMDRLSLARMELAVLKGEAEAEPKGKYQKLVKK